MFMNYARILIFFLLFAAIINNNKQNTKTSFFFKDSIFFFYTYLTYPIYLHYRKDIRRPKDKQKISEVQTSTDYTKNRKIYHL